MAEIKLDDTEVEIAMQAAILQAIGAVGREAIIKCAVAEITKTKNSHGQMDGPLWTLIRRESDRIAETILRGKIENDPEFLAAIESVYSEAAKRFLSGAESREKLIEKVVSSMTRVLGGDRY
jgi:hypothetical protein